MIIRRRLRGLSQRQSAVITFYSVFTCLVANYTRIAARARVTLSPRSLFCNRLVAAVVIISTVLHNTYENQNTGRLRSIKQLSLNNKITNGAWL